MQNRSMAACSLRNIKYSFLAFLINSSFAFLSQTIFIYVLSRELLGLNGLFSNILGILSISELGISSVMNYNLYKPIKENNIHAVKAIMKLYRKLYFCIGTFIIIAGCVLMPLLPIWIKDTLLSDQEIKTYFILYVLNSACSYFYSYKRALLVCGQKEYVLNMISVVFKAALFVIQTIGLIYTANYMVYLIIAIAVNILENLFITCVVNKKYPYIKNLTTIVSFDALKDEIGNNIRSMIRHKMAYIIVFYTDNILISRFVGLAGVGAYSNYTLIVSSLTSLINRIFQPLAPTVGMLSLNEDKKHIENVLYTMLRMNFSIYFTCTVFLVCMIQPFVCAWAGGNYMLDTYTMVVIVIYFYVTGMRKTVLMFWENAGIFRYDKYKPIVESIVNLITSIILGKHMGIAGVLIGTIISTVCVCFWWEAQLLFKHLLGRSIVKYLSVQAGYLLLTALVSIVSYTCCLRQGLIIRFIICLFFTLCTLTLGIILKKVGGSRCAT